jgi:hypothetical protein
MVTLDATKASSLNTGDGGSSCKKGAIRWFSDVFYPEPRVVQSSVTLSNRLLAHRPSYASCGRCVLLTRLSARVTE